MKKYYVCTPFWRSIEENKKAFVDAESGSEAAKMVLGGRWKVKNPDGVSLDKIATVYRLDENFPVLAEGTKYSRINAKSMRHYVRINAE